MQRILFKDATIVNEGKQTEGDLLVEGDTIAKIGGVIHDPGAIEIDCSGHHIIPGIIDDQVHFREPGLTHKASIYTESCAAVAGGVTSFMEMPNTNPTSTTQERLQEKYDIAAKHSAANYSFFMGANNENLEEVLKTDPREVCGVKVFMGSSTGNMLVDDEKTLTGLFKNVPILIATHCEEESIVRANIQKAIDKYGDDIPWEEHPIIRSREACIASSKKAIDLASKFNARLHILHITTEEETHLFSNKIELKDKRLTSEVCVHHLSYNAHDYSRLGSKIKCNPAIKTERDQNALWEALLDDRLDIIATDHAPHTMQEKSQKYLKAPSGLPLIQHTLLLMLRAVKEGKISLEKVIQKMCHTPAICFDMADRGYIREGYKADLVQINLKDSTKVIKEDLQFKCGWSPLEGETLPGKIVKTMVSGKLVYEVGQPIIIGSGQRLSFNR